MSENIREIYELFNKLQTNLSGSHRRDAFKHVAQYFNCNQALKDNLPYDETTLISKISNHLASTKSQNDVSQFLSSYERLSACMELKERISVLTFLLYTTDTGSKAGIDKPVPIARFCNDISSNIRSSSNMGLDRLSKAQQSSHSITLTSGIPSTMQIDRIYPVSSAKLASSSTSMDNFFKLTTVKPYTPTNLDENHHNIRQEDRISCELNEDLVQDVIYAFTGIQGKYLKKDVISGGFRLDLKSRQLNITHANMLLRLGELGYYHDQIQSFTDPKSGRTPLGLLGQGLVTALKKELTQYYGMVSVLQEQLNRQRNWSMDDWNKNKGEQLTLMKMMLWAAEPLHRLQWLRTIAEAAQEKKGGTLATSVAKFQNNGDPCVRILVNELLLAVCGPLIYMLGKWLSEGEIDDPHAEFFIEILPEVGVDRLWNEKYRVREAMLPNFISRDLANKILVTGKSINFLREVCQDKIPIRGKEDLKQCFETNGQDLFSLVPDTKLHMLIDTVYLNTSKRVLDIAMGPHKLLQHLQAMRNYLLLGQGDFIGILLENLKPELDRPAKELYSYELSAILDAAIRSTNAQYDDPEILNQLDVKLFGNFEGDVGWDIFTLNYTVQGPLSTMLEPSMNRYQVLFKPLWKMKHLEFVLSSKIWKHQLINAKLLRPLQKELNSITYRLHLYTSEMIHFVHQMQYYILFEVIECLWTNMLERIQQAKTLDDILEAHEEFLREVKTGMFLDEGNTLFVNLETVLTASVKLEVWQEKFYEICFKELQSRKEAEEDIKTSEIKGQYGITTEKHLKRDEELKMFEDSLSSYHKSLDKIGRDFECAVRQFLLMLASDNDHNLQLFGTRLDFNEYYKKRDYRLDVPLTFANMRQSSLLYPNKSNSRNSSRFALN